MLDNFLQKKGFGLMDMLVTVGIAAVLMFVSLPYIRQYQTNLKLSSEAKEIASTLRYAQQLTVTEQVPYSIKFYQTLDYYELINSDTSNIIETHNLDSEVFFNSISGFTDDKVIFNFYGAVSEPGQIVLENSGGNISNVNVKPSGYVEVTD